MCATRVSCCATGMRVKEPCAATRVHVSKDKIEDLKRNPNKSRAERERIKSEEEEEEERSPKSDLRRRRRRQGFQPVTREHNVIDAFFKKKKEVRESTRRDGGTCSSFAPIIPWETKHLRRACNDFQRLTSKSQRPMLFHLVFSFHPLLATAVGGEMDDATLVSYTTLFSSIVILDDVFGRKERDGLGRRANLLSLHAHGYLSPLLF